MSESDNRSLYHFDDFTEAHYRHCLQLARQNYRFVRFPDYRAEGRVCLWRHDIDTSPHRGLRLAQIEAEEGVVSTFFVLLHSDRYHPLEKDVYDRLKAILALGHDLGLHFDPQFYGERIQSAADLEHFLALERHLLEETFQTEIRSFSFHNPSVNNSLRFDQETLAGMVNAYGAELQSQYDYCSDSFCYWRYRRLVEVLEQAAAEKIHILTHPVCWTEDVTSPYVRFVRAVEGRAANTLRRYQEAALRNKRKIVE